MKSGMPAPAKRPATYEDLKALPENMVGQIIDGELIASPRPGHGHARATSVLGVKLGGPFDLGGGGGPGGWFILDEPELHFSSQILVPDIAGWRRERMPKGETPFFTVAPDWVCEVLSPSTARIDRVKKKRIYAREQVKHIWLVDPAEKTLEAYRLEGEHWTEEGTFAEAERVRVEPFEAIELDLGDLWLL
jgi:Uma2 family endonuclease